MGNIQRGLRSIWRNGTRTAIVLIILGLVYGMSLVMLAVESGVAARVAEVESSVGTLLDVRPAGSPGMGLPEGDLLSNDIVESIGLIDGVTEVNPVALARWGEDGFASPFSGGRARAMNFVIGVLPGRALTAPGGITVEVVSGRGLEPGDEGLAVVVMGSALAEARELAVGDARRPGPVL